MIPHHRMGEMPCTLNTNTKMWLLPKESVIPNVASLRVDEVCHTLMVKAMYNRNVLATLMCILRLILKHCKMSVRRF